MGPIAESLFDVIRSGAADRVERLLTASPGLAHSRTADGASAVLFAIYSGHPELAPLFERAGVVLSFPEACAAGRADVVAGRLENDPSLVNAYSEDGYPALALAVFFGHEAIAEYLVEHGADVNAVARNPQQVTALHAAIARRNARMVRELLEHGADPNAPQAGGLTPLESARAHGAQEIVELLVARGA